MDILDALYLVASIAVLVTIVWVIARDVTDVIGHERRRR